MDQIELSKSCFRVRCLKPLSHPSDSSNSTAWTAHELPCAFARYVPNRWPFTMPDSESEASSIGTASKQRSSYRGKGAQPRGVIPTRGRRFNCRRRGGQRKPVRRLELFGCRSAVNDLRTNARSWWYGSGGAELKDELGHP
jgi:hypothetical protein